MNTPDLTFLDPDERPVSLSSFRGRPLLLIFTRHVACTACRSHLVDVATMEPFLRERNIPVLAVTFTPPKLLKLFLSETPQPFPMVSDPNRDAYRLFELKRASLWSFFRPIVFWRYLRQMFAGFKVKKPVDKDVFQLGGDFVIDAAGKVTWSWVSQHAQDRPTREQLRAALASV